MGYALDMHLDAPTARPKLLMAELLLGIMEEPGSVYCERSRHRRGTSEFDPEERVKFSLRDRDAALRHVERELAAQEFLLVEAYQDSAEDEDACSLEAHLWITPPEKPADPFYYQQVPYDVGFWLRWWVDQDVPDALPEGLTPEQRRSLGRQLSMLRVAERMCLIEGVERGYVMVEQAVFNPLCYRLMFHANPADFAQDLHDVVELALRGGKAFGKQDSRHHYEPLMERGAASIDFCDRTRAEVSELRAKMERVLPALDARGLPVAVPEELVRRAAARSGRYAVFEDGRGGLGVRGLLPRNPTPNHNYGQFPVVFLDEFYLDLAELVLEG